MKIGLYGGSFDPIHQGHVEPTLAAVRELALDRVFYLPTAQPPHKGGRRITAPLHRFVMTELALLAEPRLVVSEFEMRPEVSFTIDTIEHFQSLHLEASWYLLIGSDSLAQIESWRRWEEILDRVRLAVLSRPGWTPDEAMAALTPATRERLAGEGACFIDNSPLDISATEIRRRLGAGESVPTEWVDGAVVDYARKYGLYS